MKDHSRWVDRKAIWIHEFYPWVQDGTTFPFRSDILNFFAYSGSLMGLEVDGWLMSNELVFLQ